MAPSASDIARLRRMTSEPTTDTYSNEELSNYLAAYPNIDSNGKSSGQSGWTESYDLHAAAAEIWSEKAATLQTKHDFSADGASFSSNQMYENAMDQARYHLARSKVTTKSVHKSPKETSPSLNNLYQGIYANIDDPENPDVPDNPFFEDMDAEDVP